MHLTTLGTNSDTKLDFGLKEGYGGRIILFTMSNDTTERVPRMTNLARVLCRRLILFPSAGGTFFHRNSLSEGPRRVHP